MDISVIEQYIQSLVDSRELVGGSLLIRRGSQVVCEGQWGHADVAGTKKLDGSHIFRLMSMTKPITAVGILKLLEQGKLSIDDPLYRYAPEFRQMRVVSDPGFDALDLMDPQVMQRQVEMLDPARVLTIPANRPVTLRDLLSHSSGIGQGNFGMLCILRDTQTKESLQQQAQYYASLPLAFQPGCGTGYSPFAGFDLLGLVIERASGMDAATFFRQEIFEPLDMVDTTFDLGEEQRNRLVDVCARQGEALVSLTGKNEDVDGMLHRGPGYIAGSGGLYSTLADYDHFAQMLLQKGTFRGQQMLRPETVELMATEAPAKHLEAGPGTVWGLGVLVRQNDTVCTPGTYGWSGAFSTHFFVSPRDELSVVWMTNRADLGGSASYVSRRLEELVFASGN